MNPEAKAQVPEAFETLTRFLHQSDTWQLAFGCLWGKMWIVKDHEAWASIRWLKVVCVGVLPSPFCFLMFPAG